MRTGFRFRQHLFCAFPMPCFRLRHVFVTPSARLRDRSSKALGLSNLRSDLRLDSANFGRWYLDSIGGLTASSMLGSLAAPAVVGTSGARGLLFDVASSGQTQVQDPVARCGRERGDEQLSVNVAVHDFLQQWSTDARGNEKSVSETCSATPIKCTLVFARGTMCQR